MKLKDKVAIVTGAASGIGRSTAELFAKEGAKVVVADINGDGAKEVAQSIEKNGGQAFAFQINLANKDEIIKMFKQTLEQFETLDILINNAGIMDGMEPIHEIEDDRWDSIIAINTTSVMHTMREATNLYLNKDGGVIVNIVSVGGLHGARAGAAYAASKFAVVGLTLNTAFMYADKNIRCNAIAPGGVETNIGSSMKNISEFGMERQSLGMGIMPRSGQPEELAKAALFLASDDSSFINGDVLVADGGWTAY